jgi:uncharacterized protein YdcH (DUF465 family)
MKEEEIVEALKNENEDFKRLYSEHRDMDTQLSELNKKTHLSPEDEVEVLRIKKEKLKKKDKIADIVRQYKKQHSMN